MATNFATESLKSVTTKATEPTSSVTTSDSAVAEVRAHQPLHQDTSNQDTQHTAPTLSDSAVAELKAAYVAVEQAIADARSGSTASGSTASSGTATDTKTTDTATTDKTTAEAKTDTTSDTHQPPADPLVKLLADATGETTATVQGVLQQVRAVQHQEHLTDASGHTDTTKDTGTSSETTSTSTSTGTATGDAKPGAGDAPHWHDRLIAQQDGSGTAGSTDAATGHAAADADSAIWQHFLNHYASGDSAVTGNAGVVAAVDAFVDTVQSLHLDPGHGLMNGQTHGHGTDGAHLDTAA